LNGGFVMFYFFKGANKDTNNVYAIFIGIRRLGYNDTSLINWMNG